MDYPFAVRRATPADKDSIVALAQAIDPGDWVIESYDGFMSAPAPAGLYLAEREGQPVGICLLEWPAPHEAYLSALRIDPGLQGKGLGSFFVRAQVEQIRTLRVDTNIYLLSHVDNLRAHRAFQKNGFEKRCAWIGAALRVDAFNLPAPRRVRRARSEDAPFITAFHGDQGEAICARDGAWTVLTMQPEDWDLPDLIVAEGAGGLEGVMNLSLHKRWAVVRRLEGTPEAAADLLAYALAEARARGHRELEVSLPARCEPLLVPMHPQLAYIEHLFVFCLPAGKPLPTETP